MRQMINMPLSRENRIQYDNWAGLYSDLKQLRIQGIEAIWGGEDILEAVPRELVVGYHLIFFADWLDFYRGDWSALKQKFGSVDAARDFYGGTNGCWLLEQFRQDLVRAKSLQAQYVVFHVTDISIEETHLYRWLHSHEEVIDTAVEVINELLDGQEWPFLFLVENQWWPGFTFTDPLLTERLIDGIHYAAKGILLDTGHLMNTEPRLQTQRDGIHYIHQVLDRHGSLCRQIRAVHFHQSLSGTFVRDHVGHLPPGFHQMDYLQKYKVSYEHILHIDRHRPWTDPMARSIIDRIAPDYLTHELAAKDRTERLECTHRQIETLAEPVGRSKLWRSHS